MFDPTKPVNGTTVDADFLRTQFNDLDTRVTAGIPGPTGPQGNPGTNGTNGAPGAPGAQGNPGNDGMTGPAGVGSPVISQTIFEVPIYMGSEEIKFDTTRDINGSSECLAGISATDSASEGPLLNIRCREAGGDRYIHRLDLGGCVGNGGPVTVLDGDLLQFRSADQTWHPVTGATQDVAVGGLTLHFLNGVFTGAS